MLAVKIIRVSWVWICGVVSVFSIYPALADITETSPATSVKSRELEAALHEAEAVMKVVTLYYSVLQMSSEIDPILARASISVTAAQNAEDEVGSKISRAESLLDEAALLTADLPPLTDELKGKHRELAIEVRNFLPDARVLAENQVSLWRGQYNSLVAGNVSEYQTLVHSEIALRESLIELANILGKARLSSMDMRSPGYHVQESIVLGNELMAKFVGLVHNYETSTHDEDSAATAQIGQLVARLESSIKMGFNKVEDIRNAAEQVTEVEKSLLLNYASCSEQSLVLEKSIFAVLKKYEFFAHELVAGSFGQADQEGLAVAEVEIQNLSLQRSRLKSQCANAAVDVIEYASD